MPVQPPESTLSAPLLRRVTLARLCGLALILSGCGRGGSSSSGNDVGQDTTGANEIGDESGGTLAERALVHSLVTLPLGKRAACEHDGSERILSERIRAVTPQRMYSAGCTDAAGVRRLFVSVPVEGGHTRTHPVLAEDHKSALIFEAELDTESLKFSLTGNAVHRGDCLDAHGIAVASDCSTVATLCRRPHFTSDTEPFTQDLVAEFAGAGDIDQPGPIGGMPSDAHKDYNDEMWLYEWQGRDLARDPETYVVHKGIGPLTRARGLGSYYLINGENDQSYGYAVRASTGGGSRHVADSFLVIDRSGSKYAIAEGRGYTWACGRGHTIFNRPVYNPENQTYAIWCSTDTNEEKISGLRGLWFRTESSPRNEFALVKGNSDHRQGGVQVLQPLANGNFLGAFIADPSHEEAWGGFSPTKVGLVQFDGVTGETLGEIRWVVEDSDTYLGHAQLAPLSDDRYVLGFARLHDVGAKEDFPGRNAVEFMIPQSYHLVEIDTEGNLLSEVTTLEGAGWGDMDQWSMLGPAEIAWAYIPKPEIEYGPPCRGETLQLSYYGAGG